jgi:hypothetical protein
MTDTFTLPRKPFHLASGAHSDPKDGACFMELAALIGGQPFNDAPACVSPVIRGFGIRLNDRLGDEPRQRLRPFVLRALGTAGDGRDEERRRMAAEWLLTEIPRLLDLAGAPEAAEELRATPIDAPIGELRAALRKSAGPAWEARRRNMGKLRERVREAVRERYGPAAAVAVAAVDAAAAVAVAAAVVVAAAAAVDAVAADVVVAVAVVAAVAADAAVVVAAVADDADAADAVDADAKRLAFGSPGYWKVRNAAAEAIAEKMEPLGLVNSAVELLDRMLPAEPIKAPAVEGAELICAAP